MESQVSSEEEQDERATKINNIIDDVLRSILEPKSATEDVYAKIRSYIEKEHELYNNLLHKPATVDYRPPLHRAAYVYLYVAHHTDCLCSVLESVCATNEEFKKMLQNLHIGASPHVLCIGGGPGSDALGLHVYLEELNHRKVPVTVRILDKSEDWNSTWCNIEDILKPFSSSYTKLEFGSADCLRKLKEQEEYKNFPYKNVKLTIMLKFLSAIKAFSSPEKECRDDQLKIILNALPDKAFILVLDNPKKIHTHLVDRLTEEWFSPIATSCGFKQILTQRRALISTSTFDCHEEWIEKLGSPKGSGNKDQHILYILYQKIKI